jgi:molybdate transport system substrate-binding protein
VLGAASLVEVLTDEVAHFPGPVRLRTGGSNLIVDQVLAGARADVVIAANARELERLVAGGRAQADGLRALFRNQLVVIAPVGSSATLADMFAAGGEDFQIAIAHPEAVPAGRYAKAWLVERGAWDALAPRAVLTLDVRAALAAVASGAAEFGIVYATDAATSAAVRVVERIEDGPEVAYFGVVVTPASGARRAEAERFLAGLDALGADGAATVATRARLRARGFGVDD